MSINGGDKTYRSRGEVVQMSISQDPIAQVILGGTRGTSFREVADFESLRG